jgi:hypothetical protein
MTRSIKKIRRSIWQWLARRAGAERFESRRIDFTDRLFDETLSGRQGRIAGDLKSQALVIPAQVSNFEAGYFLLL